MDRIEAVKVLNRIPVNYIGMTIDEANRADEALSMAARALRPITREQVERVWRGEWIAYLDGEHIMPERYYSCSKCGGRGHLSKKNFCDFCGAPITDEAVDMVMERLEALYGQENT